jgi:ribosomal protein L39E
MKSDQYRSVANRESENNGKWRNIKCMKTAGSVAKNGEMAAWRNHGEMASAMLIEMANNQSRNISIMAKIMANENNERRRQWRNGMAYQRETAASAKAASIMAAAWP